MLQAPLRVQARASPATAVAQHQAVICLLAPFNLGKTSLLAGLLFQGLQPSSLLLLLGQERLVVVVQLLLGPGSLLKGLGLAAVLRQWGSLSRQAQSGGRNGIRFPWRGALALPGMLSVPSCKAGRRLLQSCLLSCSQQSLLEEVLKPNPWKPSSHRHTVALHRRWRKAHLISLLLIAQ